VNNVPLGETEADVVEVDVYGRLLGDVGAT